MLKALLYETPDAEVSLNPFQLVLRRLSSTATSALLS